MKLSPKLEGILSPAYRCPEFDHACTEMRWDPDAGHVPRGFRGACGELWEVELILIVAEPGDPYEEQRLSGLESTYEYSTRTLRTGKDLFHRNVLKILDMCWPGIPFDQQMRKVWVTESVLCSARKECGPVSWSASQACGRRYLLRQLALFPHALVVALGGKARSRLNALGVSDSDFLAVSAVAPPEGNKPERLNLGSEFLSKSSFGAQSPARRCSFLLRGPCAYWTPLDDM
jgi:hypothetical protein